jgi:hypothetical protein
MLPKKKKEKKVLQPSGVSKSIAHAVFKQCEGGCGIIRKISFEKFIVSHTLLLYEGTVGLPIVDHKGGNCRLQGELFILIAKFSMGLFNTGGNCKLQFTQMKGGCVIPHFTHMKFVLVILHPPSHCLNERHIIPSNELVVCKLVLSTFLKLRDYLS